MKWTAQDQATLDALNERRELFYKKHRPELERVIRQMDIPGDVGYIADMMIAGADELRDALAPFDSGIRAGQVSITPQVPGLTPAPQWPPAPWMPYAPKIR